MFTLWNYYHEGKQAAREGINVCPYQEGSQSWAWWQAGWSHGHAFAEAA